MSSTDWLEFTAVIEIEGINPNVAVPAKISKSLGIKGYIPVELNLDRTKHIANLVPLGGGKHRLYLNGPMLKATGWKVGDRVVIKLRHDPKPRVEPMSSHLLNALIDHSKAKAVFDNLSPSKQKEINRYLNNLKSTEAIDRNIPKIIAALEGTGRHMLIHD